MRQKGTKKGPTRELDGKVLNFSMMEKLYNKTNLHINAFFLLPLFFFYANYFIHSWMMLLRCKQYEWMKKLLITNDVD